MMPESSNEINIPFPYEPYPQQTNLMRAIYDTIAASKSGCFESPTGTGKSLSVICAAMYWQQKEEMRIIESYQKEIDAGATSTTTVAAKDDWLADILQGDDHLAADKLLKQKKGELDRFNQVKLRISKSLNKDEMQYSSRTVFGGGVFAGKKDKAKEKEKEPTEGIADEEEEFVLPMYDSDDAAKKKKGKKKNAIDSVLDEDDDSDYDDMEDETDLPLPKIFYCSRTHTQIAQFVSEIRRTLYSNARVVTLSSRKNFCIHHTVSRLSSDVRMSDQCLEMQKSGGKKVTDPALNIDSKKQKVTKISACEYHNKRLEERFADQALGQLRDIEELVSLGRELKACPYYATRRAVRYAQVVCMPYNVLIHEDLRKSMGVDLKGGVVIFDEAHNLIDAVNHTHSAEITMQQLSSAAQAVAAYMTRFQYLLGGKNVYYLNVLGSVIRKVKSCLINMEKNRTSAAAEPNGSDGSASSASTALLSSNEFIFKAGLDNVNLFKLRRHIIETNLVARIGGYAESQAKKAAMTAAASISNPKSAGSKCDTCPSKSNSGQASAVITAEGSDDTFSASNHALRNLLTLVICLTNNDADGRVAMTSTPPTAPTVGCDSAAGNNLAVRFILLNPSVHFCKIVEAARNVILLGGTLRPFSFIASSLFAGTPATSLNFFSCGHVVDRSAVTAIAVSSGSKGHALEFTHNSRLSKTTTDELHGILLQTCQTVPHGFVCFFTSYAYMESLLSSWKHSGQLALLTRHKPVFSESRSAAESEAIWAAYCAAAAHVRGSLLFCVMGGKLSEGINFSDHLARCVAVVGMPYPDMRDPILQEKLKRSESIEANSGKKVYEAMCMKSVNQSIGRSIRHVRDYAAILLIDKRYSQQRVIAQLPNWIERSVRVAGSWIEAKSSLEQFFAGKPK